MAKYISPFGKLMDRLDITISELAESLYLDKTTISKWRTGSRKIMPKSPHFDTIVRFMTDKNNSLESHPLNSLWLNMHPGESNVPSDLTDFLREYVNSASENPFKSESEKAPATPFVLPEYKLFVDKEGRKESLDLIMKVAEQTETPCTLKILELDYMDWLCQSMAYMKKFVFRLEQLALRGVKIEFAFSTLHNNRASYINFIFLLEKLRYSKNVQLYFIGERRLCGTLPRIYVIPDFCAAVGLNAASKSLSNFTNFFGNYPNAHGFSLYFDHVIKLYAEPASVTDSGVKIDEILSIINQQSLIKQDLFYFSDYLSVTTMSPELLQEILELNNVYGRDYDRCFNYYTILRTAVEKMPDGYYTVYYHNMQAMEAELRYDSIPVYELSALTNRVISMNGTQYHQHLKETVEFLKSYENLQIVLRFECHSRLSSYSWLKSHAWELSFNTKCSPDEYKIGFLQEKEMMELVNEVCEQSIESHPLKHSMKQYNLKKLEDLGSENLPEGLTN